MKNYQNEIVMLPLDALHSFKNHPFKMYRDDHMDELIDSIKQHGLLSPILVRPHAEGGYEIISGHNRAQAMEYADFKAIPAFVKDVDDDTAICMMVDSNLRQREKLYPSEKAWAFRMKLEAMKRQGERTDLTCSQVGNLSDGKKTSEIIAEEAGESKNQIYRYIRLTHLIEPLQTLVDLEEVNFTPAVEISYLRESEQVYVASVIALDKVKLSLAQAKQMKELSRKDELDDDKIEEILLATKTPPLKVVLRNNLLRRFFPQETTTREMQETIIILLESWKSKTQNHSKPRKSESKHEHLP